jgi:hypothetical protein
VQNTGVKIVKADLDMDDRGIVVTGFVDPGSFHLLQVDAYQREELSDMKIQTLMNALRDSRVPTVELGMRGDEGSVDMQDDVFYLEAPVFIIDGLQRTRAAQRLLKLDPSSAPKIQATIHLNSSFDWERKRFEVLNLGQTKVNGNVTLRNMRHDVPAVELLYRLSFSRDFVLRSGVSWDQNMKRGELISSLTFAKTIGMLHSHIGPGRGSASPDIARGLQKIMGIVGKQNFQTNIKTFYDLVNACWSIEAVAFRNSAIHLKAGFLLALAQMFSDHSNFWEETKLSIDKQTQQKLATFPMRDTTVVSLSNQGGKSTEYLAQLLADHINKGRRTNKLSRRNYVDDSVGEDENGGDQS